MSTQIEVGNTFVVKCKEKGFDFIPCLPASHSQKIVTELQENQKLIYCGPKQTAHSELHAFWVLLSDAEKVEAGDHESRKIWLGDGAFEFLYPVPKKRRRIRRKRRVVRSRKKR